MFGILLSLVAKFTHGRRSLAAYCIITASAWNIWNERNRRIFGNKFLSPMQLLLRI
uniref:Uncharacterized protein n=1 Tax=Setaria viridis TaxID=4556 RepID=A0A4U6T954_SETVI|nr:hypothetical protein SEVIR_9G485175v2 [Setaria viridis]